MANVKIPESKYIFQATVYRIHHFFRGDFATSLLTIDAK